MSVSPPVERASADAQYLARLPDAVLAAEFLHQDSLVLQFGALALGTFGTAQLLALLFQPVQGFAGALAYERALYLGTQPEGECQYLALDVVTQLVIVLDGVDPAAFLQAFAQYLHNHEEASAQT